MRKQWDLRPIFGSTLEILSKTLVLYLRHSLVEKFPGSPDISSYNDFLQFSDNLRRDPVPYTHFICKI